MRRTLKTLQDRKAKLITQMRAMITDASTADREFSDDETAAYAALEIDLSSVNLSLTREASLQQAEREMQSAGGEPSIDVGVDRAVNRPWASLDEQLTAVVQAGMPQGTMLGTLRGGVVDPRLYAGPSGASSAVGADGGFLVQKDFSAELFKEAFAVGILSSRCDSTEIGANSDGLEVVYVDESSRATGSRWGGVRVYRRAEADAVAASMAKLGKWECRLEDMMGLAYVTERLMQDGGAMADVFRKGFNEEFSFKLDDEIFAGTGAGQCLGLTNYIYDSGTGLGSTISIAKEAGQAADTILAENIINMWTKVLPSAKARGFWFTNTETNPQLLTMQIGTGASGQLVYMAPGGLSGSQYGTIYGRPVIEIEHASALGDLGDIMFADLSRYKLITKGGVQEAESMHVRFLYNERAFRWVSRVNGMPKLKSAITPYRGAAGSKLSPFVTLAAR